MSIFDFTDYKALTLHLIQNQPRKGFGQFRKIAKHLNINSVVVSQIFKGTRDLNQEQAFDLASYFGMDEVERRYYLLLVGLARAGHERLRKHIRQQLLELRESSQQIKNRVPQNKILTEEAKALFYSRWYYSAIRMLSMVPGYQTPDAISEKLKIKREIVLSALEFLRSQDLMIYEEGKWRIGPRKTHLEASSPHAARHHSNWRSRAALSAEEAQSQSVFYTGPMALSEKAAEKIRADIVDLIGRAVKEVSDSDSERVACLNIDWFDFTASE